MSNLTRRDFIKTAAVGFLAVNASGLLPEEKAFAASDCIVKTRYGTFNGFVDKNSVKTWLGIFPTLNRPSENFADMRPNRLSRLIKLSTPKKTARLAA